MCYKEGDWVLIIDDSGNDYGWNQLGRSHSNNCFVVPDIEEWRSIQEINVVNCCYFRGHRRKNGPFTVGDTIRRNYSRDERTFKIDHPHLSGWAYGGLDEDGNLIWDYENSLELVKPVEAGNAVAGSDAQLSFDAEDPIEEINASDFCESEGQWQRLLCDWIRSESRRKPVLITINNGDGRKIEAKIHNGTMTIG